MFSLIVMCGSSIENDRDIFVCFHPPSGLDCAAAGHFGFRSRSDDDDSILHLLYP